MPFEKVCTVRYFLNCYMQGRTLPNVRNCGDVVNALLKKSKKTEHLQIA